MNNRAIKRRRSGLTLVELLVVVMIITLLASVALFAMFAATETAREARTRSMITRISDLIIPIYESYRTRRVPIQIGLNTSPKAAAILRLDALRELMRMELPDRITDVNDPPVKLSTRPALNQAYQRIVTARSTGWGEANQGSECLYMILSRIQDGDTNGLEFLRETEVDDTDGDGMPEILDGWGKPIAFLRWAPGFLAQSALQDGVHANGPDQFDPLGVRADNDNDANVNGTPVTFSLYPLVFSAGADREFGIATNSSGFRYSQTQPPNNPYSPSSADSNPDPKFGTPDTTTEAYLDNLHNHLQTSGLE